MAARISLAFVCQRNLLKRLLSSNGTKVCKRHYADKHNILNLQERGLVHEIFPPSGPQLLELLKEPSVGVYAGFDPTADSLHVGNLLIVMALLHCQRAGHKVVALMGGGTAQIGDPSGKAKERVAMDAKTIERNTKSIEKSLRRIFENHEKHFWKETEPLYPARFVNNLEWYKDYRVVDFLSNIGRHFRVSIMLSKASVKARLKTEEGMSFTEFCYQIFQAYDWLHLFRNFGCVLQIGGADQMGNIHAGHELIGKVEDTQAYGFLVPLLTTAKGEKLGKTAGNAIWLNGNKTPPFDLFQYFLSSDDRDVEKLLRFFTFLPLESIKKIMGKHKMDPTQKHAQRKLAENVTLLLHGEDGLRSANKTNDALDSSKMTESLAALTKEEFRRIHANALNLELNFQPGLTMLKLAMTLRCFSNEVSAKNYISSGGFYVNNRCVDSPECVLDPNQHILPSNHTLVQVGKKTYYVVNWLT